MNEDYVLQNGAANDLRSIVRYTRDTWGVAQARAYSEKLRTGLQRLARGQGAYKILGDIHPLLRVTRCEHHYIFCIWRRGAGDHCRYPARTHGLYRPNNKPLGRSPRLPNDLNRHIQAAIRPRAISGHDGRAERGRKSKAGSIAKR